LGSAQGEGQAERYLFRVGVRPATRSPIFPYVFEDIVGFELAETFQFDALLGMDVLRQCDLAIFRTGACSLKFG
jgi:hypothetical protein